MTYLLDTDWVIDYLAGRQEARDLIEKLLTGGIAISVVTLMEVLEGVAGSHNPEGARRSAEVFLQIVTTLDVTSAIAAKAAEIRGALRRQRRPIDPRALDLLIAATALDRNLTLATHNVRHFGDIPDLKLYEG